MLRLQNVVLAALASAVSLLPSAARAACSMDAECKGARICVDGRCVDPAPIAPTPAATVTPVATASPASAPQASPPAPQPQPAPVASQPVANQQSSAQGGDFFAPGNVGWSVSLLGSLASLNPGGNYQSIGGFEMDAHVEGLAHLSKDFSVVGFFDAGLPILDGQLPLGLGTLGLGLGVGDRYRLMAGAGLSTVMAFNTSSILVGGQFILHGSVALTEHIGVHAQFTVSEANGATLIQGGVGLGIQG